MSNDRHHDEQVSAAYQDLAAERTPERLDQNVLRMAKAAAGRPLYSRWIAWSRPLAWAATIALCLAITLEFTQVSTLQDVANKDAPAEVTTPASAVAPELRKDKREQAPEQDMDRQFERAKSSPDSMADALRSEKIAPARSASKPAANEAEAVGRMRQSAGLIEEESIKEATIEPAMDFEVKAIAADSLVNECADEMRSQPESWLECIAALEASGDKEAALRQRKNLEEAFPDFRLP
jgi:hypothetical protein